MKEQTLFKGSWSSIYNNIKEYSFLISQLVRVDILAGYKKSYIGILWMVIYPIISVIMWVVLNGAGVIEPGDSSIPYPAYVLLSTSIWGFFVGIYQTTSQVIVQSGRILIMNKFPIEVLIVRKIIVHLILFTIPFVINVIVLLLYGVRLSWISLLFPFALIPLLFLGLALGLFMSVMRVVALDIVSVFDEFLKLLMFLTPIIYTPKLKIGALAAFIEWNPLAYLVGFSRDLLVNGVFTNTSSFIICSLGALVALLIATRFYLFIAPKVIERLIIN